MIYLYSQDRKIIKPFIDNDLEYYYNLTVVAHEIYCGSKLMGTYESEERCLEVIEKLFKAINLGLSIFELPQE